MMKHKQDAKQKYKQQKYSDTRQQDWLRSSSLMDYVSGSAFKMGDRFISIENEDVDYTTTWPIWMCTQTLLVTVFRKLSKPAFQRLSRFPISNPNAHVTLKTKYPLSLQNLHMKLKNHQCPLQCAKQPFKSSKYIRTPSQFRNEWADFRVCGFRSNHVWASR